MMGVLFGVVMCICLLPILLIMFVILYPKNWKKCKLIFGITVRKEYIEGETGNKVSEICDRRRRQAIRILVACFLVAIILLLLRNFILQTTGWMIYTFASIIGINIPFALGNKEMKTLKKSLGFEAEKKIMLTDISNVGAVHTLKPSRLLLPNILGLIIVIVALLVDLKVIPISTGIEGTFVITGVSATFLIVELIMSALAYVMDGMKNEVISPDSGINANYNRAKKKNLSDFTVTFLWVHVLFLAAFLAINLIWYSEILILICIFAYLIMLLGGMLILIKRDRKIEGRYSKDMTLAEDEDDYWIFGMFYYNPNNKRLNVKKRVGVGGTINLAHPLGKVISVLIVLVLLFSFGSMVYIGMAEATPMKLRIEDDKLVCHHLSDDYVIEFDSISDIVLGQDVEALKFYKISGFGMDNMLKGHFSVDGNTDCRVFLNPQNGNYIKIVTNGITYYVGGETPEETSAVFFTICPQLKQLRRS